MSVYPPEVCDCAACRAVYERGYRDGYNAHAASAQEWKDTHGPYTQHGAGENP